mmetsp:Transcript_42526/g.40780  ORF Transcript_42526/g.40780 Transcript_42526/m.40780 type:complete len:85 (+) Transcript_42526:122-376(+)
MDLELTKTFYVGEKGKAREGRKRKNFGMGQSVSLPKIKENTSRNHYNDSLPTIESSLQLNSARHSLNPINSQRYSSNPPQQIVR